MALNALESKTLTRLPPLEPEKRRAAKGEALCRKGTMGLGPIFRGKLLEVGPNSAVFSACQIMAAGELLELELAAPCRGRGIKTTAKVRSFSPADDGRWTVECTFDKRFEFDQISDMFR